MCRVDILHHGISRLVWYNAESLAAPAWSEGRMLDKQWGHDCNRRSIRCVQIGGSNNSIAAANSLMAGAWVQKSWIMQWRPAGICCPTAISFDIGQASVGITHWPNKSCRQLVLLLCPAPSLWGLNFVSGWEKGNKWPKVSNFNILFSHDIFTWTHFRNSILKWGGWKKSNTQQPLADVFRLIVFVWTGVQAHNIIF